MPKKPSRKQVKDAEEVNAAAFRAISHVISQTEGKTKPGKRVVRFDGSSSGRKSN